jgi:hypothetical protein
MAKVSLIEKMSLTPVNREFWGTTAVSKPTFANYTYSLGLWDMVTWKTYALKNADPAAKYRGTSWFQFPTPPQAYELSENAATNIIPTQNGGKFVESHGSIFKDIRLSGTVGLRPSPVDSNLLPSSVTGVTGVSLNIPKSLGFLTNDERGLPKKEITGYDDIIFLRNLFRGYWNTKKSSELARRIVMVWIYAKDSDIFIVEPVNFTTTKEKSNPLSYSYSITLRTLFRFDSTIPKWKDPIFGMQDISNVFSTITQAVRDITVAINQIANAIDYIASMPFRIADAFIREAIGFMGSLVNLRNTGTRLSDMGSAENLKNLAKELQHLDVLLHKGMESKGSKEAAFTNTVASFVAIEQIRLSAESTIKLFQDSVYHPAKQIEKSAKRIMSCGPIFEDSKNVVVSDYKTVYNRGGKQYTEGSPLDPNNIVIPASATEDIVGGNESLRDISKRTMGDESYWKMLAILNNLKPPYISTVSGDGILKSGDKILIPKRPDQDDFNNVTSEQNTDAAMESLSLMGKKYGRDIKLSKGSLGTDFSDFIVSQRGDLDVIEGIDNIRQALMTKVSTEQGELALHPTFGAAYPIGSKISLSQLHEFALNTRRTFLDDPRVEDIDQLKTFSDGDIVRVYTVVSLKQSNTQLPIEFAVRST